MENENVKSQENCPKLKLNFKRTAIIGFAFFGILLLWQVYDSWCPLFLSNLFEEALHKEHNEVQYLVGIVMALDNLAALIMLPIFGSLSDKTHTKIGKRMPYILIGTFCCAIAFPFIPILFHYHNLIGTISVMAIVVFFAMMYRNPAVALMPDITPKPLRSRANGIINIMGYLGGACATLVGMIFVLSKYLTGWENSSTSIWVIEAPFLIASILMIISALVLFFFINENKIEKEVAPEMELGERLAAVETSVEEDDKKPMSKVNKIMLLLILGAEFLWFMADNGIGTFMSIYVEKYLHSSTGALSMCILVGGFGSVIGFAAGGFIASKIGRKWTICGGLSLTAIALMIWVIISNVVKIDSSAAENSQKFPFYLYIIWLIKGFGMSLVHINSFPMVVELCSNKKVGKFTGYYYASSMAAQTITPCLIGLLMLNSNFGFAQLPTYGLCCIVGSLIIFLFVKNIKNKAIVKKGLEAFDVDD